jgi:oligopeptide transport system permease protein
MKWLATNSIVKTVFRPFIVLLPTVLLIISATWILVKLSPGNFYTNERNIPRSIESNIRNRYGLGRPWYVQYGKVIAGVLTGDLGVSLKYQKPVNEIIRRTAPVTLILGLSSYLVALTTGLALALLAASKPDGWLDRVLVGLTAITVSLPVYVIGPLLVFLFALQLYLLPAARWETFWSANTILPVVSLAAPMSAYIMRLIRAGMLEALQSDYVVVAHSKGFSPLRVLVKHVLPVAILPAVSFSSQAVAALIGGSVVVEKIFAIPGLGNVLYQAAIERDEPLIIGVVIFSSVVVVVTGLFFKVLYSYLDPRTRITEGSREQRPVTSSFASR